MGYGDSYVYCVVLKPEALKPLGVAFQELEELNKAIRELRELPVDSTSLRKRGEYLEVLREELCLRLENIEGCCKDHLEVLCIGDDSCGMESYPEVPMYKVLKVSQLFGGYREEITWGVEELEMFLDEYCICLPSHYDTEGQFLKRIGLVSLEEQEV